MRIYVQSQGKRIHLMLPTQVIFSAPVAWLGSVVMRKYMPDAVRKLPQEAIRELFREVRRMKRKHGSWDLVEVDSKSGEKVLIRL